VGTGVLGLLLVLLAAAPAGAATLPPGFTDERVAAVGAPTALAFLPDGTPLVATQPGRLVALEGTGRRTLLDLGPSACTGSERGLLGIAVDPAYAAGRRALYAFWTRRGDGGACDASAVNRISRFPVRADGTADRAGEVVLVDRMPSPAGNHNGGDLAFGRDGLLHATIGDGGCDWAGDSGCAGANDAARDRHVLTGKVLRITADGAVPAGNPFAATGGRCATTGRTEPGRHCAETFAWGLRNPFRLAFDPDAAGTRFFVNDVGQNAFEEIDEGRAGADYGWNAREGRCRTGSTTECGPPPPGLTDPVHAYGRGTGCASITGGAFVPDGVWPAAYDRDYLFADYVCGTIFRLTPRPGGGFDQAPFVTGLGTSSAVHLAFGPHAGKRALFYTTYAGGGEVRRITHTGSANRAPVARLAAAPAAGPAPLRTTLSAAGSSDPDGDALTHLWSFGDGTADATTDVPSVAHTYARPGAYTATLRVRDARGAVSEPATVRVDAGNAPPVPRITAPGDELRFRVGQAITLRGEATDAEDGAVPAARLSWRIVRRHADHTHRSSPATAPPRSRSPRPAPRTPPRRRARTSSWSSRRPTRAGRPGRSPATCARTSCR
jgi:glucose/arabinose dehydrogenase